jgi:phosphoribosylformimino-5-aminoimidazole carboxamide ribotide isomerase
VILIPAVDIKDGKAVRLRQGKAGDVTVFADDPVDAALDWQAKGAARLHVVDLDGAFDGVPRSRDIVGRICARLSIPVQLGGGIRDRETARAYLDAGVDWVIVGTMALEDPDGFAQTCAAFPGRVGVSLDAQDGRLRSRGWVTATGATAEDVLPSLVLAGAAFAVYTDIERDGMQGGVNVPALTRIATLSAVPVIAAGGVTNLEDVKRLFPLTRTTRLTGAISGRALYEGTLDLPAALAWIAAQATT